VGFILLKLSNDKKASKCNLIGGIVILIACALLHMAVLPFADMTLLSTTQATAIIAGVLLSIFWLGEPLVPKYDLPALALMMTGGLYLCFMTNKTITFFTTEELGELMTSKYAIAYYCLMGITTIFSILAYKCLMKSLKEFETQTTEYINNSNVN
jgi:multidrug transporter EmrE-like cation transporter